MWISHHIWFRWLQARLPHMCRIMHKLTDFSAGTIDLKTTPWPLHHSNVGQPSSWTPFFPQTSSQWNSLPKCILKNIIQFTSFKQTITNNFTHYTYYYFIIIRIILCFIGDMWEREGQYPKCQLTPWNYCLVLQKSMMIIWSHTI